MESPKPEADMEVWKKLDERAKNLKHETTITLVGKYVELEDAYISVTDALQHAGYLYDTKIKVNKVQAEDITEDNGSPLVLKVKAELGGFTELELTSYKNWKVKER